MSFTPYKEAYLKELENRENIEFSKLCRYNIKPLDDALRAIAPKDLVVISASSGFGKSELALHISRTNAIQGKKVAHYNLEGGWEEAMQRLKWREMCELYYKKYHHVGEFIDMDYQKWVLNETKHPIFKTLESEVYADLLDKLGSNLLLYDNPEGLNCDKFCKSLITLEGLRCDLDLDSSIRKNIRGKENIDIIVIDHLHYFSLDKDENEIREITAILQMTRKITAEMAIPVILVAHLRKLPRGHGIPDKEDIYGTSNIHKIANTCIILAPDHENDDQARGLYPTYIRIAKSRQGLRPNILMHTIFNIHERKYLEDYQLYKCFPDGSIDKDPIPYNVMPKWAKGQKNEDRSYTDI